MLTLAQILADSPVPMLPEAGALERFVLESPWMLGIGLCGLAVIAFYVINKTGSAKRGMLAAGIMLACAAAVMVTGMLVTTEREKLQKRTLEMVALTTKAETAALKDYLDPRVTLSAMANVPAISDRETLLEQVRRYPGETYKIREHSTSHVGATIDGENVARTQLRVWVRLDKESALYDAPVGSWWRIDWRRDPIAGTGGNGAKPEYGPWRVSRLTLMQLDGLGVNPEFAK